MINTSRPRKRKHQLCNLDLSIVPPNVFSLRGEPFYQFIQEITSEDMKDLLVMQRISTARCFLNTNPLDVFNIRTDDPLIVDLQGRLSFRLANGNHAVLAGINGDVRYLTELLSMYSIEIKKQRNGGSESNGSIEMNKENDESTTNMSSTRSLPQSSIMSIEEHRHYINEQIQSWWEKNQQKLHGENHQLIDHLDYQLIINTTSASIMCSCGIQINLLCPNDRYYYQLSNFYKHLNKNQKCKTIREQKFLSASQETINDGHQGHFSSSSSAATGTMESRGSGLTSVSTDNHQSKQSTNDSSLRSKRKRVKKR